MDEDCLYWLTVTNLRRRDIERFYFAKRFVGQITWFLEIIVGENVYLKSKPCVTSQFEKLCRSNSLYFGDLRIDILVWQSKFFLISAYSEFISTYGGAPSRSPCPGNPIPRASIPTEMHQLFLP